MDDLENLSPKEKEAFDSLEKIKIPPASVEDETVKKLKLKKLIRSKHSGVFYLKWASSIAASVVIFLGGWYFGQYGVIKREVSENTALYLLLLHEDENFRPIELPLMVEEYANWLSQLGSKGRYVAGEELQYHAYWINNQEQREETFAVDKDKITGYFIIEAENSNEALAISQTSPHLKYGGTIELREIVTRQ